MAGDRPHVVIYTDGGCDPNPGPGGYGVVLLFNGHRKELSGGYRLTTNNRMEIMAAIVGLKALNAPCRVTLYTDSEYVANAMSQSWVQRWRAHGWKRTKTQPALNADLWEELLDLCAQHEVTFVWTRGHAGDPENERCDRLARQARNAPDLPPDPGYPSTSHRLGPLFGATRLKI